MDNKGLKKHFKDCDIMMRRIIRYTITLTMLLGSLSVFAEYTTNACSRLEYEIETVSKLQLKVTDDYGTTVAKLQEQYDMEMAKLLALEEIENLKKEFIESANDMTKDGGTLDQFRDKLNKSIDDASKMIIAESIIDQLIKFGGVDQGFSDDDSHLENLNNFKSLIRTICRSTTREVVTEDQRINTAKQDWETPLDTAKDPYPQLLCDSYYADKKKDKQEAGGFTDKVINKFYNAYMAGGNLESYKKALAADMPSVEELGAIVLHGSELQKKLHAASDMKRTVTDRAELLKTYPLDTALNSKIKEEILSYQQEMQQMLDKTKSENTPAEEALKNLDLFSGDPDNPVNEELFAGIFQNPKGMEELESKIARNYQIAMDRNKAHAKLGATRLSTKSKGDFIQGILAEINGNDKFNRQFCTPEIYSADGFDQQGLLLCLKQLVEQNILPSMIEDAKEEVEKLQEKINKTKSDEKYHELEEFKKALITDWKNRNCNTDMTSIASCSMDDPNMEGTGANEFNRLLDSSGKVIAFLEKNKLSNGDLDDITALCQSSETVKSLGLKSCVNVEVANKRKELEERSKIKEKHFYNGNVDDGVRGNYDIWGTALSLNMRSRGFNSLTTYFMNDYWAIENQSLMLYNQAKQQQYYNMLWDQYYPEKGDYSKYGGWGWSLYQYPTNGFNFSQ